MQKNTKNDRILSKEQKQSLTHKAFWKFAASCSDRTGVDLYEFQSSFRSMIYPNRQTPHNEETKKIQNTQNKQIDRIIKSIPKVYPNVEIVTEDKFPSKKKFRPFIRLKTYNYQNSIERKSHREFLNSDIVKKSKISNKLIVKNIKENIHLIDKYNLQDVRDKSNGLTAGFSEKNVMKWKEGTSRIPSPLLLLVICAVHKWIEGNKEKLNIGRPRKTEFDKNDLGEFIVGTSKLLELGDNPTFNYQILEIYYGYLNWWNEIEVALDCGLSPDETAQAIWNLYGKELSYNPSIQHENYFNIKHVREEVDNRHNISMLFKQVKEMFNLSDDEDILETANKMTAMASGSNLTVNSKAAEKQRKSMFGELVNSYFDHATMQMQLYSKIYGEFKFYGD